MPIEHDSRPASTLTILALQCRNYQKKGEILQLDMTPIFFSELDISISSKRYQKMLAHKKVHDKYLC